MSSILMQYAVRIEMRDMQAGGANGGCSGLYLVVFKIMLRSVATLIAYISYILKFLNLIYQFNVSDKFDVVFVKNISLTYSA